MDLEIKRTEIKIYRTEPICRFCKKLLFYKGKITDPCHNSEYIYICKQCDAEFHEKRKVPTLYVEEADDLRSSQDPQK